MTVVACVAFLGTACGSGTLFDGRSWFERPDEQGVEDAGQPAPRDAQTGPGPVADVGVDSGSAPDAGAPDVSGPVDAGDSEDASVPVCTPECPVAAQCGDSDGCGGQCTGSCSVDGQQCINFICAEPPSGVLTLASFTKASRYQDAAMRFPPSARGMVDVEVLGCQAGSDVELIADFDESYSLGSAAVCQSDATAVVSFDLDEIPENRAVRVFAREPGRGPRVTNKAWDPNSLPIADVALIREPSVTRSANACNDGIDNDGDGLIDWGQDLACTSRSGDSEDDRLDEDLNAHGVQNDGWTVFEPVDPADVCFVGSGAPAGVRTEANCFECENYVNSRRGDGNPDFIFLDKSGDHECEVLTGSSIDEPMVYSAWGTGSRRPSFGSSSRGPYDHESVRPRSADYVAYLGFDMGGFTDFSNIIGVWVEGSVVEAIYHGDLSKFYSGMQKIDPFDYRTYPSGLRAAWNHIEGPKQHGIAIGQLDNMFFHGNVVYGDFDQHGYYLGGGIKFGNVNDANHPGHSLSMRRVDARYNLTHGFNRYDGIKMRTGGIAEGNVGVATGGGWTVDFQFGQDSPPVEGCDVLSEDGIVQGGACRPVARAKDNMNAWNSGDIRNPVGNRSQPPWVALEFLEEGTRSHEGEDEFFGDYLSAVGVNGGGRDAFFDGAASMGFRDIDPRYTAHCIVEWVKAGQPSSFDHRANGCGVGLSSSEGLGKVYLTGFDGKNWRLRPQLLYRGPVHMLD